MTAKTMAESLARRNFEAEYDDLRWDELTDSVKQGLVNDAQAIIDFLSAAGFGLVADAKAEATRKHAAAALRSVDDIWGSAGRQIVRLSEIRESAEKVLNGDWDNHLRWNLNDIAREQARAAS